nr:MAG TPA: hypothetical protein [Caudoviricetes sp.]
MQLSVKYFFIILHSFLLIFIAKSAYKFLVIISF